MFAGANCRNIGVVLWRWPDASPDHHHRNRRLRRRPDGEEPCQRVHGRVRFGLRRHDALPYQREGFAMISILIVLAILFVVFRLFGMASESSR